MIYSTVENAVALAIKSLKANHIAYDTECIRNRVYSWYNHSDVTDPEMLAACALMGQDWYPEATYEDMLDAREWWFPRYSDDDISIWEIEAAQHDAMWQ